MKKLGLAVVVLFALAVYAQSVATDNGSKTIINHSNGELVFPYDDLAFCRTSGNYSKCLNYYTARASYPTQFIPKQANGNSAAAAFDAGCQKYSLVEDAVKTGRVAGRAMSCTISVPFTHLDAGVYTFFNETDGGYAVSQCPSIAALNTTAWLGYCIVQAGNHP